MEKKRQGTLVVILLLALTGGSAALEIRASSNPAVVGSTLTLTLAPPPSMRQGSWSVGDSLILNWSGDEFAVVSGYNERVAVDVVTGALTLSSVTVADTGVYVVKSSDPQLQANIAISVFEPISQVTLTTNRTDLLEFTPSAVMRCSVASGSSLTPLWTNGSSEVTVGDRVGLADGNLTLTVANVSRYDRGPFRCHVSNPLGNGTSDPVTFTISYGPDNMALAVNGSLTVGSNVTLQCSAQSNPPAQLHWAFQGQSLNTTASLLELYHVAEADSGSYSCLAFNNRTKANSSISSNILINSAHERHDISMWLIPLISLVGSLCSLGDKV